MQVTNDVHIRQIFKYFKFCYHPFIDNGKFPCVKIIVIPKSNFRSREILGRC